jgi:hypothetical protein
MAAVQSVRTRRPPGDSGNAFMPGLGDWWAIVDQCQREMIDFVSQRLTKDGFAVRETLDSRNLKDALDVQCWWVQEALRDYNHEVSKVLAIIAKGDAEEDHDREHRRHEEPDAPFPGFFFY